MTTEKSPLQPSIYDGFTHKYKLSKTLRFELRPVGKTSRFLEENGVVKTDRSLDAAYEKLKPFIDNFHRLFVEEALAPESVSAVDFSQYEQALLAGTKGKELKTLEDRLQKEILEVLDRRASLWQKNFAPKSKKSGTDFLVSADILGVLAAQNTGEAELFDKFKGFTTYLGKFQQTRENLYKDDGTATAIPTRIVQNFIIYRNNQDKVAKGRGNLPFDTGPYTNYFTQKHINDYNRAVGLYNTEVKKLRDKAPKEERSGYKLLKTLHNQILAEKEIEEDLFGIASLNDVKTRYIQYLTLVDVFTAGTVKLFESLPLLNDIELAGVYLNNKAINTLSRKLLRDWQTFELNLTEDSKKRKAGEAKVPAFVSLKTLKDKMYGTVEDVYKKDYCTEQNKSVDAFAFLCQYFHGEIRRVSESYESEKTKFSITSFSKTDTELEQLKAVLDAGLRLLQVTKYFSLSAKKETDKPVDIFDGFYETYVKLVPNEDGKHEIVSRYDAFRNFLTKKPDAKDKIKLNFEKGNLLSGWAESGGKMQFRGYILRKGQEYFLGISTDDQYLNTDKYPELIPDSKDSDVYEKLEYFSLNWGKNIAGGQVYSSYTNTRTGKKISYQEHKGLVSKTEHVSFMKELIRDKYVKRYQYLENFIARDFATVDEMRKEFEKLPTSGMGFAPVHAGRIDAGTFSNGKKTSYLYLFKIHNKDFAPGAHGTKNMHTEYFLSMFSKENLLAPVIKIMGGAEIFFRDPKLPVQKRNLDVGGKEIIEKKRYTEAHYFLHLPIELNTGSASKPGKFNQSLNTEIISQKEVNVIGIDRGEKHLAYFSVVKPDGSIVESGSFNIIGSGKERKEVDYHKKLDEREKEKRSERQSWKSISQIKDLKKGYISQVVHKIVSLATEHNAVIVLEDLNFGFKQQRSAIEKSIYQQLEKALIDKLSYLAFKDRNADAYGGIRNAYQLAVPVPAMKDVGKQAGIVFFVDPSYTSTTDPITGWRQHIYKSSVKDLSTFIGKIKIYWDNSEGSYMFRYDQRDFDSSADPREWCLKADCPRLVRFKEDGVWKTTKWYPNERLETLLKAWGFDERERRDEDISDVIGRKLDSKELTGKRDGRANGRQEAFYDTLWFIFSVVQQIRNATTGEVREFANGKVAENSLQDDFIASPVAPYYMTKSELFSKENTCGLSGVDNGDALGAYNIARKGLMVLEKIKLDPTVWKLNLSRKEWDEWAQSHGAGTQQC